LSPEHNLALSYSALNIVAIIGQTDILDDIPSFESFAHPFDFEVFDNVDIIPVLQYLTITVFGFHSTKEIILSFKAYA